jgi:hypothetical protein
MSNIIFVAFSLLLFLTPNVKGAGNLRGGLMLPLADDGIHYDDDDGIDFLGDPNEVAKESADSFTYSYYYDDNYHFRDDDDNDDLFDYFYYEAANGDQGLEVDDNDDLQEVVGFTLIIPLYFQLRQILLNLGNQSQGRVLNDLKIDSRLQTALSEQHPMSSLLLVISVGAFVLIAAIATLTVTRSKCGPVMDRQIK